MALKTVFEATETWGQFDAYITVRGGGQSGQAGAIRHGIAKALVESDPNLRVTLKRAGYLTPRRTRQRAEEVWFAFRNGRAFNSPSDKNRSRSRAL